MTERTVFRPGGDFSSYQMLTGLVVPRPIAWVSSLSADGVGNLAPHSFFTIASPEPPIVAFTSVGTKDTLTNVVATGEFTVSLVTEDAMAVANRTSTRFGPEVDEAVEADLAMAPSEFVAPPRVADSAASIECELHSTVGFGASTMIFGRVVAFTVADDVLDGHHPIFEKLRPASRLGRDEWGLCPEVVRFPRP